MKTLTLYEVGSSVEASDPLPIEGASIVYFTTRNHSMDFYSIQPNEGIVEYLYGDFADTLEEALKVEAITVSTVDEVDEEGNVRGISLVVDGEHICEGVKWLYSHEWNNLHNAGFSFATWSEWEIAHEQGWCSSRVVKEQEVLREDFVEGSYQHRSFGEDVKLNFITYDVHCSNTDYIVVWVDVIYLAPVGNKVVRTDFVSWEYKEENK